MAADHAPAVCDQQHASSPKESTRLRLVLLRTDDCTEIYLRYDFAPQNSGSGAKPRLDTLCQGRNPAQKTRSSRNQMRGMDWEQKSLIPLRKSTTEGNKSQQRREKDGSG